MSNTTIFNIVFCVSVGIITVLTVVWGIQIMKENIEELEKKKQGLDRCEPKH